MFCSVRRFGAAALFGLALLGPLAPPARAHFFGFPGAFGVNSAVLGNPFTGVSPIGLGGWNRAAALATSPAAALSGYGYGGLGLGMGGYGGLYNPYLNPYYGSGYLLAANPYSGYLTGAAAITNANANYFKTIEGARLKREEARQASIETRRKMIEEMLWEQKMRPSWQDLRDQRKALSLRHYRTDAFPSEIESGEALNGLYDVVSRQLLRKGSDPIGTTIPLDPATLKKINLTGSSDKGNIGLLKDDGKLQWPYALEASPFSEARKKLSQGIADAVQQAKNGNRVDRGDIKSLNDYKDELSRTLTNNVNRMSPSEYIQAQRYLNKIRDAIRLLESDNVTNYFNHEWDAKGKTVAELVKHMAEKGLRFAPAGPGEEAAYNALYNALAAYDASLPPERVSNGGSSRTPEDIPNPK